MELVERWWNSQFGADRRDIWLNSDGQNWHVLARHGGADGEVHRPFRQEWEARAMVDSLIKARPAGRWRNITNLVTNGGAPRSGTGSAMADEQDEHIA